MTSQPLTALADQKGQGRSTLFARLFATDLALAPLALRLSLGLVMFPHGAQKALGWFGGYGFSATTDALVGMGVAMPLAIAVILIEILAPLMLIAGAGTRLAALGLAAIMVGAITTVHGEHGFFMNWFGQQAGEGFEYHILVIGMAAALVVSGAGRLALDHSIAKRLARG